MKANTAPNPADYSDILGNIETLWSMKGESSRMRGSIGALESELPAVLRRISELDNAAIGYSKRPDDLPLLQRVQADLATAKEEAAAIRGEIKDIQAELAEFERRESAVVIEATPAVVARHQHALSAAESAVEALQRHRSEIITRLDKPATLSPVSVLLREREDALAALALGEPREPDLAILDARIEAATAEAAPAMAEAEAAATADRQTLAGIDRRLIAAAEELRRLRRATPALLGSLLVNDMRELAAKYESAAKQAAALLLRLKALEDLRQAHAPGVPSKLALGTIHQVALPMPLGDRPLLTYHALVGLAHGGEHIANATRDEVARLGALGVVIQ